VLNQLEESHYLANICIFGESTKNFSQVLTAGVNFDSFFFSVLLTLRYICWDIYICLFKLFFRLINYICREGYPSCHWVRGRASSGKIASPSQRFKHETVKYMSHINDTDAALQLPRDYLEYVCQQDQRNDLGKIDK